MNDTGNHHVAWKDRLGLNKLWMMDLFACSEAYGTPDYIHKVDRLRNDIINIKDSIALYDKIDNEWNNTIVPLGNQLFDEWVKKNPQEAKIDEERQDAITRIRDFQARKLHHFILQLLEKHGFGFYQSTEVKHGRDGYLHYNDEDDEIE